MGTNAMEGTYAEKPRDVMGCTSERSYPHVFFQNWGNHRIPILLLVQKIPRPTQPPFGCIFQNHISNEECLAFFNCMVRNKWFFSINSSEGPLGHCYPPEAMMGTRTTCGESETEIPGVEPGFTGEFPWWGTRTKRNLHSLTFHEKKSWFFNEGILISWFIIIPTITWGV